MTPWIEVPSIEGLRVRAEERDGRSVITGVLLRAPRITPEIWRSLSISRLEAALNAPGSEPRRARLTKPNGNPDEFSRRVAAAYWHHAAATRAPAKAMAAEAGVPVRTVHRWIREARLRGVLKPGMRGKAG